MKAMYKGIAGYGFLLLIILFVSCKKQNDAPQPPPVVPETFKYVSAEVNNKTGNVFNDIAVNAVIRLKFSGPVNKNSATSNISLKENSNTTAVNVSYEKGDSVIAL